MMQSRQLGLPATQTTSGIVEWWSSLTTSQKIGVGLGGTAAILLIAGIFRKGATPNKRKRRKNKAKANPPYAVYRTEKVRQRYGHEPFDRIEGAVRHAERDARSKGLELVVYDEGKAGRGPYGEFVAMFRPNRAVKRRAKTCQIAPSVPSCRCSAPTKYYRLGARKRGDYAFPECWMYPVHTPHFVRAAASRFGKFGGNVPTIFRGKVAARIRRAKKKFGIGEFRSKRSR